MVSRSGRSRPRVLLLRYHSLGDVILVTGLARALAARGWEVDVATEERFTAVFRGLPFVRRILRREDLEPKGRGASAPGRDRAEEGDVQGSFGGPVDPGEYARVVDLQGTAGTRRLLRGWPEVRRVHARSAARRWLVLTGRDGEAPGIPHAVARYAEAALPDEIPSLDDLHPEVRVEPSDDRELARRLPRLAARAGAERGGEASEARAGARVGDGAGRAGRGVGSDGSRSGGGPERAAGGRTPRVALLTGASRRSKAYPRDRFAEVGRRFADRGWEVLWVEAPGPGEGEGTPSGATAPIGVRVALPLAPLKAALGTVDLAISGDSGPMHLAAALGRPLVAIFGSTVRGFGFFPLASRARVLEVPGLFCRPCGVHGRDRCWRGGFPCLDQSPEHVVEAGLSVIGSVLDLSPPLEPGPRPEGGLREVRS